MNPEIVRLLSSITPLMLVFWAFKTNKRIKDLEKVNGLDKVKGRR